MYIDQETVMNTIRKKQKLVEENAKNCKRKNKQEKKMINGRGLKKKTD